MYRKPSKPPVVGPLIAGVVFLIALLWVMTVWNDRTLDFWASYFGGHPIDVPTWVSFLSVFTGPIGFAVNIATEVARLVLA